jgi:SAM-dependent methyltransferase
VGDVEEGLPPGPFDLVYISFVLLHTRRPDKIVQAAYEVLRPGGHIWVKDLDPGWATALQSPSYRKLVGMIVGAMTAMGAHPNITVELPALLAQAGFVDTQRLNESYVLGGMTTEGRTMLAVILGVFYNARGMLSRMQNISEAELERLHLDLCNAALRSNKELGREEIANIVAMRPLA